MRIKIFHETVYNYDVEPGQLVQRLHLTPVDFAAQKTLRWKIESPGIEDALSYVDGFGNTVHLVTPQLPGRECRIIAEGEVETVNASGMVQGLVSNLPEQVYTRQTDQSRPNAAMNAALNKLLSIGPSLEQGHAIMHFVNERIAYEVGSSEAETTAAQAFTAKRGVCQDHAHIMLGLARALKVPARYVTGYLVTGIGATSAAAHAWAELLIADLGWVGFDAANGQCPTEHYVRLASGLDAASVAPVKGTRRGAAGSEHLAVAVRAEIAQQ